ncbi:MAG TPA: AsmA family protein [Gallionella sp.]|nr:AsmA family protein [Gallionella sp.]
MDNKTIFDKTPKGDEELHRPVSSLPDNVRRALLMVDGVSTFNEISKRAAPSLRHNLAELFERLEKDGFIVDRTRSVSIPKMVMPPKIAVPAGKQVQEGAAELDFTAALRTAALGKKAPEKAQEKVPEAAMVKAEAEAKARLEAEAIRRRAELETSKAREEAELARQQAAAAAKAREEAERRAREEAEAVRKKAEHETAQVRAELEAARAKAEAEVGALKEAEQRARAEAEALRLKAEQETEAIRRRAEQEAAQVHARLQAAKAAAEAEAKARKEAEQRAQEEAEALRRKAEHEAAQVRAELEAARAMAEVEAKARQEAEQRAREEAEASRRKAEQEAERVRAEMEARRVAAEEAAARAREEAERAREEAKQRAAKEAEALRVKAEEQAARARAELEAARATAEAEARARKEAEQRAREEAEALRAQSEQETARIRAELEAVKAAAEAEAKARKEAEQRAREEAEALRRKAEEEAAQVRAELKAAKAAAEAAAKAREEAEQRAREEVKQRAREAADAVRVKAEQEAAQIRAELDAAKAAAEAAAKARKEAEQRAEGTAEEVRAKAEQEAAQVRAELQAARAVAEVETKARKEAEQRAQEAAEAVRLKTEQEAAQVRAELEAARAAKAAAEASARAREEAEQRARKEAEAERLKVEHEAAQVRVELEAARAAKASAEAAGKAREEAERRARGKAEAVQTKAEQEAAQARAELEVAKAAAEVEAKARKETEQRIREEAEAMRLKSEQEAAQVRAQLEAAKAAAEAEAKARQEVERRAREEVEAARLQALQVAEQEAAKVREEAARLKAEVEARVEAEKTVRQKTAQEAVKAQPEAELAPAAAASLKALQEAEAILLRSAHEVAHEEAKLKPAAEAAARSTSATVLFFDMVGYTKLPVNKQIEIKKQFNGLVSDCLNAQEDGERIILDTGDGAAIGFLQHPEDALEVAMKFRKSLYDRYKEFPDLKVRMGIHLGPINIVKDIAGRSNMVGDGINDAQRVMSFAGTNQIYISRPFYDFVSRLTDEYAELFRYRGSQKDKHGREHQIYELAEAAEPAAEAAFQPTGKPAEAIKLEPFTIELPETPTPPAPAPVPEKPAAGTEELKLMKDIGKLKHPGKIEQAGVEKKEPTPEEEAKPAAKVRIPTGKEVEEFAEEQSKTWAAAEQRAVETAKAKVERAAQPAPEKAIAGAESSVAARLSAFPVRVTDYLRHLHRGKAVAGLIVLVLIVLVIAPYVLPMRGYATGIEERLAARLQQPAHIGQIAFRLFPTPHFNLGDVTVGEANQIKAQQVQVNFGWSALFAASKPIKSIKLDEVEINGAALQQATGWMRQIAADDQFPVSRIVLNQGKLVADGLQVSGIGGEFGFDQAGKFSQAKLLTEDNKYALDVTATPENTFPVTLVVRGSALPVLPNWMFDELNAKGELKGDELIISDLFGRVMGGVLLGQARISWHSGWQAQGSLEAKVITLANVSKTLGGDVDGKAKFRMESPSFSRLIDSATLNGSFVASRGAINGINIIETARLRSRTHLPGGRTYYDELSGDLSYAAGAYHFRQLRMRAGVLDATGTLDVINQQLSGRILADLSRARMGTTALQVGGTVDAPTLQAAR